MPTDVVQSQSVPDCRYCCLRHQRSANEDKIQPSFPPTTGLLHAVRFIFASKPHFCRHDQQTSNLGKGSSCTFCHYRYTRLLKLIPCPDSAPGFAQIVGSDVPARELLRRGRDALSSHAKLQQLCESVHRLRLAPYMHSEHSPAFSHDIEGRQRGVNLPAASKALAVIQRFLKDFEESFPTSMRLTPNSHIRAAEVFSLPELLEPNLLHLSLRDLLSAIGTNKAFLQTFEARSKLLDSLHLRARSGGSFSNVLFNRMPNCFVYEQKFIPPWARSHATSAPSADLARLPVICQFEQKSFTRIGSRCRSMLVVQPVVTQMDVSISCHRGPSGASEIEGPVGSYDDNDELRNDKVNETYKIYCRTGITVSNLYDATQRMRAAHRDCISTHPGSTMSTAWHGLESNSTPTSGCRRMI